MIHDNEPRSEAVEALACELSATFDLNLEDTRPFAEKLMTAFDRGVQAETRDLQAKLNIAVNTARARTPDFDVEARLIAVRQREAADRRAWVAEDAIKRVQTLCRDADTEDRTGQPTRVMTRDVLAAIGAPS